VSPLSKFLYTPLVLVESCCL